MIKHIKAYISILISLTLILNLAPFAFALHADVNNDDYIGIDDAVLALRFATGIEVPDEEQEHIADLNYDGIITTEDVRLIMRGAAEIDEIPDHWFSDWEYLEEPTCRETGIAYCYCYYCGKEVEKVADKVPHDIIPATCERASYCSFCNESFGEPAEHEDQNGYCVNCGVSLSPSYLYYNNHKITFGSNSSRIKSILGEPNKKLKDSSAEKTVVIYIYYTDYKDLGIFTFTDGKLTQFFSNATTARVEQDDEHYGIYCKSAPEKIGNIDLTVYADELGSGQNYSFCATVGEAYNLTKTTDYTVLAKLNVYLTNGLRALNGVSSLKYCEDASAIATGHSEDMASRNFFEHTNPDGETPANRFDKANLYWTACGENIVAGYYDPYDISNGWYNSEGHRKNILNKRYKYLGVGFAYSETSTYKYYGTQNFYNNQF